jgi:hypothetical protein
VRRPVPYTAVTKLSANGHSSSISIYWPSDRNPLRSAIWKGSSGRYLCELAVRIGSPSSMPTANAALGTVTVCSVHERPARDRRWIGIEIENESTEVIIERLNKDHLAYSKNEDFVEQA